MEEITGEHFVKVLYNNDYTEYEDVVVNIKQSIAINLNKVVTQISFNKITFKGNSIRFYNLDQKETGNQTLKFINCIFHSDISFQNCRLNQLKFYSTEIQCEIFIIKYCTFNEFSIKNTSFEKSTFQIKESSINHVDFEKINISKGKLNIEESHFPDFFSITLSTFKTLRINNSKFLNSFDFISNKSISTPGSESFYNNEFHRVSFFETSFNNSAEFFYSTFSGTCNFTGISNHPSSIVKFVECSFDKSVHFDKVNLSKISFENIKFNEIVSFQESTLGIMFIDKTLFEKAAYFDDIIIKEKRKTDRRTLRNIKQQLQKAENKIDYNRFRGYELGAYYRELKWFGNFKDKFILGATWLSTGFEHSWRRALVFTIISGLLWYSGLYFLEYHGSYNPEKINDFFTGAFRFFLITDFYSPFEERKYLTSAFNWLPFVLGKIFIAFGIYEMIQAFRKFKA